MKRHEALHQLSFDHQHALARALRLRRARDGDDAARAAERSSFVEFAASSLEPHFVDEERIVASALEATEGAPTVAAAQARMLAEHAELRAAFRTLSEAGPVPRGEELFAIGQLLTDHIRFEERELFELLQVELGDRIVEVVDA